MYNINLFDMHYIVHTIMIYEWYNIELTKKRIRTKKEKNMMHYVCSTQVKTNNLQKLKSKLSRKMWKLAYLINIINK